MDIERIIELGLMIGIVVFYYIMPVVAKRIYDQERRRMVVNRLNIVYLLFSLGLICFIVYECFVYDMANDYKLSRAGLIFITIVMYCYTTFFKKKQWFE